MILQVLDDHSRKIVGSLAAPGEDAVSAWAVLVKAFASHGLPAMLLSDNSLAFNGSHRRTVVDVERNLCALGVRPVASRPYHPQTCGKNERSHRTLHLWLNARPDADTLSELQPLLEEYEGVYNNSRPHHVVQGSGRRLTRLRRSRPRPGPPGRPSFAPRRLLTAS
jgi:transposase InsO family protein